MSDIRVFKFKTGEEVVAHVLEDEHSDVGFHNFKVEHPVMIMATGDGRAQFIPWMAPAASREFEFDSTVLLIQPVEADENAAAAYKQQFGIGIIEPPKQIITG